SSPSPSAQGGPLGEAIHSADWVRDQWHQLALDPHAVEDAVASGERPKATRHATHTFVTAYATRLEAGGDPRLNAIESLEDGLFDDLAVSREIQQRTCRVRKELVELRRVILPMPRGYQREVTNAVQRHHADDKGHSSELDGWYADLYDHVGQRLGVDRVAARHGHHGL
ncbi:MAG: magnesium transporter CorA family protein, partial [Dermatophilaceae bacterium]